MVANNSAILSIAAKQFESDLDDFVKELQTGKFRDLAALEKFGSDNKDRRLELKRRARDLGRNDFRHEYFKSERRVKEKQEKQDTGCIF